MSESRTTAIAVRIQPVRVWSLGLLQSTGAIASSAGVWAVDTAQKFGSLLAVLMGPAVFSTYAFASWSLAANLGWTDTFLYRSGPLSNWLIWLGIAVLTQVASNILKRRTQLDK